MGEKDGDSPKKPVEKPSGIEQSSDLLADQLLTGRIHLRPLTAPVLQDLGQLPPLSLKGEDAKSELKVGANAYTLNAALEFRSPDLTISGQFVPVAGWHRPFGNPAYNLVAQTTDKSTLFRVSSTNGEAPAIKFEHNGEGLGLLYSRDAYANTLGITAGGDPIRFGLGHDFRKQHTILGLSGQISPCTTFGVGASVGKSEYDLNLFLKIGGR